MAYTIINNKNWMLGLLAGMAVALTCCTKEQTSCGEPAPEQEGYKTLTISARSTYAADAGLKEIHSAYVFIYDAGDHILENTSNIVFSNDELDNMSFRVKYGNGRVKKNIYVIANPDAELKLKLNASLKEYEMATLLTSDKSAVFSEGSIANNGLLMSGKLIIPDVTTVSTPQEVRLFRRYARIDLMLRKGKLSGTKLEITKVEFRNQVCKTYVDTIPNSFAAITAINDFSGAPVLVDKTIPTRPPFNHVYDAVTSFYTYESTPTESACLWVHTKIDGRVQEYPVYICSTALNPDNKGDITGNDKDKPIAIEANHVYTVKGTVTPRNIKLTITDWDSTNVSGNINTKIFGLSKTSLDLNVGDIEDIDYWTTDINVEITTGSAVEFIGYYVDGIQTTGSNLPSWLPKANITGLPDGVSEKGTIRFTCASPSLQPEANTVVVRLKAAGVLRDITINLKK